MNTNRTLRITSIIEKRQPLARKIEDAEANLRSLSSALDHLETCRKHTMTLADDPSVMSVKKHLEEVDFSAIRPQIAAEIESLSKLKVRFSRNTLNIGVVGRARQGKSRLLQSLTGLTAAEIPDGDRQHCTGVRSTIHHNPVTETYGKVWFYSEQSFLDEVISLYYRKLNLGATPVTIQDFASKSLPPLPSDRRDSAKFGAMYKHLGGYHANVEKYRQLLREPSPRRITKEEIREYVAQDTLDGRRIYFNYLAVQQVEIVCNFPNADVGQIGLVDMPGLGDTGVGDAERLVKIVGEDVDAVLFVRMPKSDGDHWADVDVGLYDTASEALLNLPINLWSFMVLNHNVGDSSKTDNRKNCQDLADDIANQHINVSKVAIANCANNEEANNVLDQILDYLADNIAALDKQYASSCQDRLSQLQSVVDSELDKAQNVLSLSTHDEDNSLFDDLFNDFWQDITNGLVELLINLREQRDFQDNDFKEQVDATLKLCREDTSIPALDQIEKRRNSVGSYARAYSEYLDDIRTNLSQHFLKMDIGLKRSIESAKSQVTEVLVEEGHLGGLTKVRGAEFLNLILEQVPENLSSLRLGFYILSGFELSYRGLIQHRIRKHLDGLTPDLAVRLRQNPSAQDVLITLEELHLEAIYRCETALQDLLSEPSKAAFAIVEEFVDRVLRAKGVKKDWKRFSFKFRADIWPDEFEQLNESIRVRQEWQSLVNQAVAINQAPIMQFLN